jgi:ADP-L-glycero-D-manno-heptose 6-epimerase
MGKKVIVTGAAGFIGRNVVAELNNRGVSDILLVDSLGTDEKWRNLVGLTFEDLVDKCGFLQLVHENKLSDIDTVIHLGACSATTERDTGYLLENNYRYTRSLCEWCLEADIRFIYASSAATYGDGANGYSDADKTTKVLEPLNMYGYSKHMIDLWALCQGYFDRIVGLKYFNVFGPYEDHKGEMRSLVNKAYSQVLQTGEICLFKSYREGVSDGEQKRDFIYVKDAVDVTLHFYEERSKSGLFNCGTGKARTWKDLAAAVFSAVGKEPKIRFVDMPESLRPKYQYFTEADTKHLRQSGYEYEFTPVEDAVRDYVTSYLESKLTIAGTA